jgi:hypothetical protein
MWLEERRRLDELEKALLQKALSNETNGKKDTLEELTSKVEQIQKLAKLLKGEEEQKKRGEEESLFEMLKKINDVAESLKKLGFDVKPAVAEEYIRRVQEEAYRKGLEEGVKKAREFTELAKLALDKLGPSLNKLLEAIADYLQRKEPRAGKEI